MLNRYVRLRLGSGGRGCQKTFNSNGSYSTEATTNRHPISVVGAVAGLLNLIVRGRFQPARRALGPWCKPPATSRFLFQTAVKPAGSQPTSFQLVVIEFRIKILRQRLKGGLDPPAFEVQPRDGLGRHRGR